MTAIADRSLRSEISVRPAVLALKKYLRYFPCYTLPTRPMYRNQPEKGISQHLWSAFCRYIWLDKCDHVFETRSTLSATNLLDLVPPICTNAEKAQWILQVSTNLALARDWMDKEYRYSLCKRSAYNIADRLLKETDPTEQIAEPFLKTGIAALMAVTNKLSTATAALEDSNLWSHFARVISHYNQIVAEKAQAKELVKDKAVYLPANKASMSTAGDWTSRPMPQEEIDRLLALSLSKDNPKPTSEEEEDAKLSLVLRVQKEFPEINRRRAIELVRTGEYRNFVSSEFYDKE